MAFTDEQVMLTLAGLTYRGFADPWRIPGHEGRVRAALEAGLADLAPVTQQWDLVWGPATGHEGTDLVDSSMMFVVRHRHQTGRHVVAIRGTNPISLADWGFGDLWVDVTVPWPWAGAASGAAVSASTALGLGILQSLRSRAPDTASPPTLSSIATHAVGTLLRLGARVSEHDTPLATLREKMRAQVTQQVTAWVDRMSGPAGIAELRGLSRITGRRASPLTRPRPSSAGGDGEIDLLTFLHSAARVDQPLEITVTGHSKGAALAPAVALWLREALDAPDESWDPRHRAQVHCYAYAGPTPGNAAFAHRFEAMLGAGYHHVRNHNDIVTHAWQVDELTEIPKLYGDRTALFRPVIDAIVTSVAPLNYRQAQVQPGVREFTGLLRPESRSFTEELIHQHLDAYLHELRLDTLGIDALTLFLG